MAKEKTAWQRWDEKENEREEETSKEAARRESKGIQAPTAPQGVEGDRLLAAMDRADPMIEQLNNLYAAYIAGADRIPPTERRKQLDQLITTIQMSAKPTRALAFRADGLVSKFNTYRDRWDKLMKDLESGKITRRGGLR
jgi:hypothetical protein